MRSKGEESAIVKLDLPDRSLAQSLLSRWTTASHVTVRLIRGRITRESARLELEIRGGARGVAALVHECERWSLYKMAPGLSCAGA